MVSVSIVKDSRKKRVKRNKRNQPGALYLHCLLKY